jgi:glycerol-3-phosphate acyltransferase PlsY
MLTVCIVLSISYLIGSIPTSIIVGRWARGIDIRQFGSGNAGATNVYRVLGLKMALLVFIVDAGKAAATLLLLVNMPTDYLPLNRALFQIIAGSAIIAGNIWPIFAGFSGGKGVSTSTGVLAALTPLATGSAIAVWLAVTLTTKYVSLGSMAASLTLPAVVIAQTVIFHRPVSMALILFTLLVPAVIISTHRSNIRRLLSGTERHIGSSMHETDAHQH